MRLLWDVAICYILYLLLKEGNWCSFIFWAADQGKPEQWKPVICFFQHDFVHLHWGTRAAAPPSDIAHVFEAGVAVGEVEGLQDALICAGWLRTDLRRALWALWKLSEQTGLFTFAQETNFGPRHTLILLPVQDVASGKKPPGTGECSTGRSSQSSPVGNLSHFKGENSECRVGWVSPYTAFPQEWNRGFTWFSLSSHPCAWHVSNTPLLLLCFLVCHQVWHFSTTQTGVFPVHDALHRLISVLMKRKKRSSLLVLTVGPSFFKPIL